MCASVCVCVWLWLCACVCACVCASECAMCVCVCVCLRVWEEASVCVPAFLARLLECHMAGRQQT